MVLNTPWYCTEVLATPEQTAFGKENSNPLIALIVCSKLYGVLQIGIFHVFGSLCYPTNDCDDLGKMKPKADIGIFIGLGQNDLNFQDSSEDSNETPSKEDLDNLLAPQIVSLSEEPIANEPTTPVSDDNADESVQEDTAELDENTLINPFCSLVLEEDESSSTNQDLSNMHKVKWLWKNKTDAENTIIRNNSCLVAKGYRQEEGINFEESFAPGTTRSCQNVRGLCG
ncbi:hypothetical protein Tco_0652043 [Tanacetum coccineum]|uniref:Reverse transcriptase Ty1/copia-type domain-containing protein n=1 Tax=Tanacetum coccineum TaxID=301880 RepID=A0ABQ4WWH0_9ASTR